ncbi:putative amidase [Cucumis melo var. makuwa]|uniref:Amidase n=1 Tax=Cucumis melo var. makuwa TaxID=1194695 RepID=A0A5A7U293_CUCMM|nr:putative amidase [Cucumis melo var. makuwa]
MGLLTEKKGRGAEKNGVKVGVYSCVVCEGRDFEKGKGSVHEEGKGGILKKETQPKKHENFGGCIEDTTKSLEIANESFNLGEKAPESKIVRKVLRSLLEKFDMKVTAIEEAHDITTLKLDELFRSLLIF